VELGRALAAEPQILLLDEPMAGMNVEEKQDMCRFILDVNDQFGTTIVLIEHDMGVVMDISDRVVVLDYGKKIGDGTPDEVRSNQAVINAYLGGEAGVSGDKSSADGTSRLYPGETPRISKKGS
jgi:branched-chain amino acid transport system ATP-binding protein